MKATKKNLPAFFAVLILLISCSKKQEAENDPAATNRVLLLKVDYLTHAFEGGKEFAFYDTSASFTISNQYTAPGDFGGLTLKYLELNEPLFDGTIIWNGSGHINFPLNISAASQFSNVTTTDIVYPANGFQNVFNPNNQTYDYTNVWLSVQRLVKVRDYLRSNPNGSVKIFLYTPGVGLGYPAEWDWIIFVKN